MAPQLRILCNVIERLKKLHGTSSANLYGVLCKDSLTVLTFTLNTADNAIDSTIDLQLIMPAEIDFCGILCTDHAEHNIPDAFKDIDVTDNPLLLKYSPSEQVLQAYFYIHQKLEILNDFEIISEADLLENFSYIRTRGTLPLTVRKETLLETLQETRKSIASGKIGFHFPSCNAFILGTDGGDSLANFSVNDLCGKGNSQHTSKVIDAIVADMLLKISKNTDSEAPNYAPVLHHVKKSCEYLKYNLKFDALSCVNHNITAIRLYEVLVESIMRNVKLVEKSLESYLSQENSTVKVAKLTHLKSPDLGHPITIIITSDSSNDENLKHRKYLHKSFGLHNSRPHFRIGNAVKFTSDFAEDEPILNPHEAISASKVGSGKVSLVSGLYSYHHYMQNHFGDDGWGCAYRSLQTVVSWFRMQGYTDKAVPSHRDIQKCLVDIGDKTSNFIGSKQWIGSTEVGFVLESMFGVQSRILRASSGEEMPSLVGDLAHHFETQGTPVMIGGGVLAHTILGVSRDETSETGHKFLILDPHYTGPEDLKTIINKGWCGWKSPDFWKKGAFYNMCLPQRPSGI